MSMENLSFGDNYFEEEESGHQPLQSKPGLMEMSWRSYVIGVEFGLTAAGGFGRVCRIEADNIESDEDVDQLIQALQQTKALLKQFRQQAASATQK